MKKFWRSGMIDKKVLREREQAEYINRLERTILELRRKPPEPEPCYRTYPSEEWQKRRSEMLKEHKEFRDEVFSWWKDTLTNRPEYDNYKEE